MRLSFRLLILDHLLELDFGKTEVEQPQEVVSLSGGPVGFALPEPGDDDHLEPE